MRTVTANLLRIESKDPRMRTRPLAQRRSSTVFALPILGAAIAALAIAAHGYAGQSWDEGFIRQIKGNDCRGIASGDKSWCSSNFCRGIASHDKSWCDDSECRGIASGEKSWCSGSLCRAWASHDKSWCSTNDCRGVASGEKSWCDSNQCRAIASHDKSWCP